MLLEREVGFSSAMAGGTSCRVMGAVSAGQVMMLRYGKALTVRLALTMLRLMSSIALRESIRTHHGIVGAHQMPHGDLAHSSLAYSPFPPPLGQPCCMLASAMEVRLMG